MERRVQLVWCKPTQSPTLRRLSSFLSRTEASYGPQYPIEAIPRTTTASTTTFGSRDSGQAVKRES